MFKFTVSRKEMLNDYAFPSLDNYKISSTIENKFVYTDYSIRLNIDEESGINIHFNGQIDFFGNCNESDLDDVSKLFWKMVNYNAPFFNSYTTTEKNEKTTSNKKFDEALKVINDG